MEILQERPKNLGFGNTGGDQRHQTPPANTAARVPPGDLAREQSWSKVGAEITPLERYGLAPYH